VNLIDSDFFEGRANLEGVYTALAADPVPALLTTGYTRKNDLAADLKDFKVDTTYTSTSIPGRLTIGAELPVRGATTIALGFGKGHAEARAAAAQATTEPAKRTASKGSASLPPATSSAEPATMGVTGVRNNIDHGKSGCQSKNWM
jgi:hypothetical protein